MFEELKDILQQYNLESVADASGVHWTTLYSWLNGRIKSPYISTVAKVAEAVNYELVLQRKEKPRLRLVS